MVHVIDNVLLPYTLPGSVQLASGEGAPEPALQGGPGARGPRPTAPGVVDAASLETDTAGMDGPAAGEAGGKAGAAGAGAAGADFATVLDAANSADLNLTSLAGAANVSRRQLAGWLAGWLAPEVWDCRHA